MSKANKTGFFAHLKGDLFGGLTAGIVALPLALAFGDQSGLGAAAGLFGAIFIGFFASLFGGTNTQISGPTAPMTAVSMLIVGGIVASNNGNIEEALPAILLVFLMAGLFQVFFGVIRIGGLIKYIPYPVVSGFMSGIGIIILVTQLLALFGYNPKNDMSNIDHFMPQAEEVLLTKTLTQGNSDRILTAADYERTVESAAAFTQEDKIKEAKTLVGADSKGVLGALKYLPKAIQNIQWIEFILALLTIIIIYGFKRITKVIPSSLVALVVVTLVVVFGNLNALNIGEIPRGFPSFRTDIFTKFSLGTVTPYVFTALSLALLGAIDSLLTSIVADNMTKTKHKSNRELIGQGIGNSIASLFGGIPGAGATIRTVVNIDSGGKTKLSGMIASILLLIVLLALGPYAEQIPKAVLAGILITVGIGVMDYKGLKALRSMPRTDAIVLLTVLLLTVFWDLIYAVGIGMVISCLMFMKKMAQTSAKDSKIVPYSALENRKDEELNPSLKGKVVIKKIEGPLFFGNVQEIKSLYNTIPKTVQFVVIDLSKVPHMDKSGLISLEDIVLDLELNSIHILFIGLNEQTRYMLESIEIIPKLVTEDNVFDHFKDCEDWLLKNLS